MQHKLLFLSSTLSRAGASFSTLYFVDPLIFGQLGLRRRLIELGRVRNSEKAHS